MAHKHAIVKNGDWKGRHVEIVSRKRDRDAKFYTYLVKDSSGEELGLMAKHLIFDDSKKKKKKKKIQPTEVDDLDIDQYHEDSSCESVCDDRMSVEGEEVFNPCMNEDLYDTYITMF